MRHRRKLAVLAAATLVLLILGAGSAPVAGAATQTTTTLYSEMGRSSCPLGGIVTEAHGFAVLSAQRSEGLTVGVSLQGGAANDTYTVHLIECKGGSELPGPTTVGTFETDANGSGTFFGDHVDKRAADHAFVGLIDDSRTSIFATAVVPI